MSKFSHLIDTVGDAVRILEGRHVGRVGEVIDFFGGKVIVDIRGIEVGFNRDELEPLFDVQSGIQIKYDDETTPALVNKVIPFGMSSEDLAQEVAQFIAECAGRIKGVGKDQYESGGHQKFETMELDELFEYAEEELRDICNYSAFLVIRLRRIRAALDESDDLGKGTDEEYEGGDIMPSDFEKEGDS